MIKRSLIFILLAAGTLVPAAGASAQAQPPAPQAGSIGIRLLEAPVSRENDPRARVYIVDHLSQGTTISRRIEVLNTTNAPQTITLYSAAASTKDGQFVTASGAEGNELSQWTSVSPGQVTVAPGGAAQATVTIAVPQKASDGERYAVVWAQPLGPSAGGGITIVNRVGIRIYLSVGAGNEPASDFTIETLQAARDDKTQQPLVKAMVRNTGGRALDMSGELQLKDGPGGLTAGPFKAELGTTLGVGQREPVLVKLDKRIPAGPWNAVITLRSGTIEHSAQAKITFPPSGAAKPVKAESLADKAKILLPLAGIILALLVALVFALRRRRKDEYAQVKKDLRRFEQLVRAQEGGADLTVTRDDDPVVAIRAAVKQAKRAGDEKTAAKLEGRLNELLDRQAAIVAATADEPAVQPDVPTSSEAPGQEPEEPVQEDGAPVAQEAHAEPAAPVIEESEPSTPAPVPDMFVPVAGGGGDVPPTSPPPADHERTVVEVLRELAVCPPGAERFALIREARSYGPERLEEQAELINDLPESLQARLKPPVPVNGDRDPAPQGSEIA